MRFGRWGLHVSLYQALPGREFEILSARDREPTSFAAFGCLTHYDLAVFSTFSSPEQRSLAAPGSSALSALRLSGYPVDGELQESDILRLLNASPAALLVLLKLFSPLVESAPLGSELRIAEELREKLGNSALLLHTNGHSELMLVVWGRDLTRMAADVTALRQQPFDRLPSRFAYTLTFPLISCDIIEGGAFDSLEGESELLARLTCHPSLEPAFYGDAGTAGRSYDSYGVHDITVLPNGAQPTSAALKRWYEFRRQNSMRAGFYAAELQMLKRPSDGTRGEVAWPSGQTPMRAYSEMMGALADSNVPDRFSIESVIFDLYATANNPFLRMQLRDMTRVPEELYARLRALQQETGAKRRLALLGLEQYVGLVRMGLAERVAGSELTLDAAPPGVVRATGGTSRIIGAATSVPWFLFDVVLGRAEDTWAGFLTFGHSMSFEVAPGHVLRCPLRALLRPIAEWWQLTHEVAHVVYSVGGARDRMEEQLDPLLSALAQHPHWGRSNLRRLISELYAHWFDLTYVYNGDEDRYLADIWTSWLRWQQVWQYRYEYVLRTLFVYLLHRISQFREHQADGREARAFAESAYGEMLQRIGAAVPDFQSYLPLDGDFADTVVSGVVDFIPVMDALEQLYDQAVHKQIWQETDISQHVKSICTGIPVPTFEGSPIQLLIEVRRAIGKSPTPEAEQALMFTLWNRYREMSA